MLARVLNHWQKNLNKHQKFDTLCKKRHDWKTGCSMHCMESFEPISRGETSFQTRGHGATGKFYLFLCSEMITNVSLSGYYKLATDGEGKTTLLAKYAKRDLSKKTLLHQSLHSFFIDREGWHAKQKKFSIPHFTGASCTAVYPPHIRVRQGCVIDP